MNKYQPKLRYFYIRRVEDKPNLNILKYNAGPVWFCIDLNAEILRITPHTPYWDYLLDHVLIVIKKA